jgi:nickel transport protein
MSPAYAHKVNIFAYAQEGKVHAEGYFVDGTKCKNSIIEVIDNKTGQKLLEGRTDENGQYSFDIPRAVAMKLVLRAGTGHQNEYVLSEDEVRSAMPLSKKRTERQAGQQKSATADPNPLKTEQAAGIQSATNLPGPTQDMEELVGKVVDSKLEPVMRILLKLQEQSGKPGLTEIVGGIGYIIGIIGIIGYLKGRAERRKDRSQ